VLLLQPFEYKGVAIKAERGDNPAKMAVRFGLNGRADVPQRLQHSGSNVSPSIQCHSEKMPYIRLPHAEYLQRFL